MATPLGATQRAASHPPAGRARRRQRSVSHPISSPAPLITQDTGISTIQVASASTVPHVTPRPPPWPPQPAPSTSHPQPPPSQHHHGRPTMQLPALSAQAEAAAPTLGASTPALNPAPSRYPPDARLRVPGRRRRLPSVQARAPITASPLPGYAEDMRIPQVPLADEVLNSMARMWVCVYQRQPGRLAHVYCHAGPMSQAVWNQLEERPKLMLTVDRCSFTRCPHIYGAWHSYEVCFNGAPPVYDEDIGHPNRLALLEPSRPTHLQLPRYTSHTPQPTATDHQGPVHSWDTDTAADDTYQHHEDSEFTDSKETEQTERVADAAADSTVPEDLSGPLVIQRTKHNYTHLLDLVVWLSDPTQQRVKAHLANIIRHCKEEGYPIKAENLFTDLTTCWGRDALLDLGFNRSVVLRLVEEAEERLLHDRCWARLPPHWQWYRQSVDEWYMKDCEKEWREWPLSHGAFRRSLPPGDAWGGQQW